MTLSHLHLITSSALIAACLAGCGEDSNARKELSRMTDSIGGQIQEHGNRLGEMIPSRSDVQKTSEEELKRAFAIEYQVFDFDPGSSAQELQARFEALGRDRWDCSFSPNVQVNETLNTTRAICKRRPSSALRLLFGAGSLLW